MLVSEVKRIGKVGKKLLENKNADQIIETIIEKPLQKVCKACKDKNIETVMSSANKRNLLKKKQVRVTRTDYKEQKNILQTFLEAGKGCAWLMINYNTLSDENRKIFFELEKEYGEDTIWFVKSSYIEFLNLFRKPLRLKEKVEIFDDKYAKEFKERQLLMMYNNKYPRRCVFIRMPIDRDTKVEDVEKYFDEIISKLVKQ